MPGEKGPSPAQDIRDHCVSFSGTYIIVLYFEVDTSRGGWKERGCAHRLCGESEVALVLTPASSPAVTDCLAYLDELSLVNGMAWHGL